MNQRSPTKQPLWPTPLALGWLALALPVLAGCQSNAQQDIIARELRMQEDQMYAMEDYLSQYQQLVCKYRSENAALRRRLSDGYHDGENLPGPATSPERNGDGPSILAPPRRRDTTQPPAGGTEIDLPDVPPLEGGASKDVELDFRPSGITKKEPTKPVVVATHEEPIAVDQPAMEGDAAAVKSQQAIAEAKTDSLEADEPRPVEAQHANDAPPQQVRLHGEVVPNDAGGGPRLSVDVEVIDAIGRSTPFDGDLSLMLLATQSDGSQQNLARWDFGAEDSRAAVDPEAGEHTMRFYLELPADALVGEATTIWVRLLGDGEKLLNHASIQLNQPGRFASADVLAKWQNIAPPPTSATIPARITSKLNEGEWMIARPGEPANVPDSTAEMASAWRPASEPIPVVVQATAVAEAPTQIVQQAIHQAPGKKVVPPNVVQPVYKAPTWSPDRSRGDAVNAKPGRESDSIARRPIWSAAR